ncbi:substrate-binding periplasmic protein [Pseudomonas sp. N040]|uniref:substrate-binding periplasmic protein n=1 Tax=Pseudomonas sp. N040 TaxID=2785325 RepID=UPI0018A25DAC|nr:transporter substrate-binding domain-containing protein [Pseudomonas sp. N040]MBF7731080.1 transporter substrate-binding domain-containing protein [Pseudomonas sp. N040]MBW7014723.1 transporter substrate-binding domain-containing protein [Pseudomonas sp. N040]
MRNIPAVVLLWLMLLAMPLHASASFRVVTEEWAPFNYQHDGQPAGFAVELLQAALTLLGEQPRIEFMPWNRAYLTAQKQPDVLIFSLARTTEREPQFQWVAPILGREVLLYRLARRPDIQPRTLEEAKRYKVGSNTLEDASTQDLLGQGFVLGKNLELVTGRDVQNIQKLMLGRIDLIPMTQLQLAAAVREAGFAVSDFVPTVALGAAGEEYYFAFSAGTAEARVATLRQAFAQLRADGTYAALLQKYTH